MAFRAEMKVLFSLLFCFVSFRSHLWLFLRACKLASSTASENIEDTQMSLIISIQSGRVRSQVVAGDTLKPGGDKRAWSHWF